MYYSTDDAKRFSYTASGLLTLVTLGITVWSFKNDLDARERQNAMVNAEQERTARERRMADAEQERAARERRIERDAERAQRHYQQGRVEIERLHYKQAAISFKQAIQLAPNHVDAKRSFAALCVHLNRHLKGIEHYTALIQTIPNDAVLYQSRGIAYFELSERALSNQDALVHRAQAITDFGHAIRLDPNLHSAHAYLNFLQGRPNEALTHANRVDDEVDQVRLLFLKASICNRQHQYETVLEHLNTLLEQLPVESIYNKYRLEKAYLLKAQAFQDLDQPEQAREQYLLAMNVNPWNQDSLQPLAEMGNSIAQARMGLSLIRKYQNQTWMNNNNHNNNYNADDMNRARQWIELAVAQNNPEAQCGLGVMYLKGLGGLNQNYAEARRLFELASGQDLLLARVNLQVMKYFGNGEPPNPGEAYQNLVTYAEQGSAEAKYILANICRNGNPSFNLAPNPILAAQYLVTAAQDGHTASQSRVAAHHMNGDVAEVIPQNTTQGLKMMKKLVKLNQDNLSLFNLGKGYKNGLWGLERNDNKARSYLRLSALKGYPAEPELASYRRANANAVNNASLPQEVRFKYQPF